VSQPEASHSYVRKHIYRREKGLANPWSLRIFAQRDRRWVDAFLAAALVLLVPGLAAAQGNLARPRVTDRVDDSVLTVLQGHTHPLALPQFDQGAAPPNLAMDRMMLVLKRSPDQQTALSDLLEQQQDKSSPNYRKWLTPDQFGQQFGPADQDIQVVTSWLTSHGFQSIQVSKGRTVVEFSGTAAQVQSALHTAIHKYVVNAEDHWANVSDPQIPAALAPVVSGIVSLHNFKRKPLSSRSGRTVTATVTPGVRPQVNLSGGGHALAPADFDVIYNVNPTTMTGAGATIAAVARSNINLSDVQQFRSIFGLPANDPQIVVNGPDPGDLGGGEEAEAVLDATWPGAVAPNAAVKLVVSADTNSTQGVDLSEQYIIDNNLADVMTESFSTCESGFAAPLRTNPSNLIVLLAEQAAAQGITYMVASGDGGPDGCDATIPTPPTPPTAASVNLLASTPFTVAVGGTQFNDIANPSAYWNATNGTNSVSAKSYIPEIVWNETSPTVAASGGGQSVFFSKPSWQSGVVGIPTTNARFVPDVSLTAADHDGYLLCITTPTGSCQGSNPTFQILSGTSASVQAFGGIMALVVQKTGVRQGQANYVFYKLAANEAPTLPATAACDGSSASTPPASTCIFYDTTAGNSNIPGETGFPATTGYDQATGLGSVNVSNLVNQWSTAIVNGSTTTLTLNGGTAVNIAHGVSVPVSITVAAKAPATGTPTGDVSLIANSSTAKGVDFFTLTNGSANATTTLLPGGTYTVTAHYAGDGTFTGSDSTPPISVTVSPEGSKTIANIVLAPSGTPTTSVPYGSSYVLAVNVMNSASAVCNPNVAGGPTCPTGTVTLTDTFNGVSSPLDGGTFSLNSLGFFEDKVIQLPVGAHSIVAVYGGDNSYSGSDNTATPDAVTVTQATTSTTVVPSPASVPTGGNVTLTATVATTSNATANAQQEPTGTVQFLVGGVNLGSPVAVTGGVNATTKFAQATASLSTTTLAMGQDLITAKYSGDNSYAPSLSTAVTVSVGAGISLSPASNTATINITPAGQSGTQTITATAASGFTGTVALTCAVTPSNLSDPPTCSFTPSATITLTTTTTSGQSTLTVKTTAKSALFKPMSRPAGPNWFLMSEVGAYIACFFLLGLSAQKRRSLLFLAMLLFAVMAVGTGCGSSNSSASNPGTATGAYTVTVTATPSSGAAQTTAIAVNVQ
jgi:subtilase family serine protease